MTRKNYVFSVKPRYSPGSPGQVDETVALTVAAQEKEGHEAHLEGLYGEERKTWAQVAGLEGIAERMVEKKGGWDILDLITGVQKHRRFAVPKDFKVGEVLVQPEGRGFVRSKITDIIQERYSRKLHIYLEGQERPLVLEEYEAMYSVERTLAEESSK